MTSPVTSPDHGNDSPASAAPRDGGYAAWSPSINPGIGRDLSDEQKLAIAFRWLAREGFAENLAGHITWQRAGTDSMLINPWGLWWREVAAGDICEVDTNGQVLRGKWDVTPAVHIHTELHRVRPDARVVIHNHPYHVCVLAAIGALPDLLNQTASMFDGDLGLVEEYTGEIDSAELGADLAERIGAASVVVLASHGVIVTGETIEQATYRAASIDRVCRMSLDVMRTGSDPLPLDPGLVAGMKVSLMERGADYFFEGAARQLIRSEPDVLD
ncbi:MAG: ribulose-5-phosphate 4-epimerase/fuculose-1-phosphate aldolase [Candidatus Aldehydirespiratoraceae bacterium]|jgi:ribulose-5-phosphate 4-epimerase/fuculose-1-phosphate aldolase